MRLAFLAVCLLMIAPAAHSADSGSAPDLESEIAWARTTWPEELTGLRFESELPKLRRWFTAGRPLVAYVFTADDACRRVALRPSDVEMGGKIEPSIAFVGGIAKADGRTGRSFDQLRVGEELSRLPDIEDQERSPDGKWEAVASVAYDAEPTVYGALSHVDDAVARFGGRTVSLRPSCLGPHDWLPCAGGGGRYCQRCERIGVRVTEPHLGLSGDRYHGTQPETCHEKCPVTPESPIAKRLRDLMGRVSTWRDKLAPTAAASLYRSLETCRREHPPRVAPKK